MDIDKVSKVIQDNKMLELYSQGHSYSRIKEILKTEFGEEFTNKELGERMGELKKEMGCATQFQMGYQFAEKEYQDVLSRQQDEYQSLIKHEKENSYLKAYIECDKELNSYYTEKMKIRTLIDILIIIFFCALIFLLKNFGL